MNPVNGYKVQIFTILILLKNYAAVRIILMREILMQINWLKNLMS